MPGTRFDSHTPCRRGFDSTLPQLVVAFARKLVVSFVHTRLLNGLNIFALNRALRSIFELPATQLHIRFFLLTEPFLSRTLAPFPLGAYFHLACPAKGSERIRTAGQFIRSTIAVIGVTLFNFQQSRFFVARTHSAMLRRHHSCATFDFEVTSVVIPRRFYAKHRCTNDNSHED